MAEQETIRRYEAETLALPPLKLVLGDVPAPDPQGRCAPASLPRQQPDAVTVLRLIARLKEER